MSLQTPGYFGYTQAVQHGSSRAYVIYWISSKSLEEVILRPTCFTSYGNGYMTQSKAAG